MIESIIYSDLRHYDAKMAAFAQKPIETGKILFYGSSGFTNWARCEGMFHDMEEDILTKDGSPAVVNHGFGGATIEEGLYYYDRAVRPWAPRAIVLRFFPNDFRQGYTPQEVVYLQAKLCAWARADFPGIKLYLCDAMPGVRYMNDNPWQMHAKLYNRMLKDYCDAHEDCTFISQLNWPGLYENPEDAGDYNKIRTDIFRPDGVHFTHEGYKIYRELFLNALDGIL